MKQIISEKTKLIVALDVDSKRKALYYVDLLKDKVDVFKIGLQLFTAYGPDIVKSIVKKKAKVFLDLKYHDIPNTVAKAMEQATELGVFMMNLHSSGGVDMMKVANEAVEKRASKLKIKKPIIIAVTVLTSINEQTLKYELGIKRKMNEQVVHLAKLAKDSGLDGVVASSLEIRTIRKACGGSFVIVTPGIRPIWAGKNDQKRINTPENASKLGADYIVVGRPILEAENPINAVKMILDEMRCE